MADRGSGRGKAKSRLKPAFVANGRALASEYSKTQQHERDNPSIMLRFFKAAGCGAGARKSASAVLVKDHSPPLLSSFAREAARPRGKRIERGGALTRPGEFGERAGRIYAGRGTIR